MYVLVIGLFFISVGMIIIAAMLQESGIEGIYVNIIGLSFIPIMIINLIIISKNYKDLITYEATSRFEKNVKNSFEIEKTKIEFKNIVDVFHGSEILKIDTIDIKGLDIDFDFYWVYSKNLLNGNYSILLKHFELSTITLEKDESKEESEVDYSSVINQIPKKGLNAVSIDVYFYSGGVVTKEHIEAAEKYINLSRAIAKSMGNMAPINVIYLYDEVNHILYHEKSKKVRSIMRDIALKRVNDYFIK